MNGILICVLNMSLTASVVAGIVLALRLLLRRAPKIYSYALWAVVLFRLLCPFSLESSVSPLPTASPIPQNIAFATASPAPSGFSLVDSAVRQTAASNAQAVAAGNSMNPSQLFLALAALLWILGICAMLIYALCSYLRFSAKLRTATRIEGNIFESDRIGTPFVLGTLRPRIYLPLGLSGEALACVLLHEQAHIRRRDHLVKPLAFLALALHWFNPLVWLCYLLSCRDMELSCDESVLRHMEADGRRDYSTALLTLASPRGTFLSPLAFGESSVKTRIKNVLHWKHPRKWLAALALILCVATLIVCAMNPKKEGTPLLITTRDVSIPCIEAQSETENWARLKLDALPYVSPYEDIAIHIPQNEAITDITIQDVLLGENGKTKFRGPTTMRPLEAEGDTFTFLLSTHKDALLSSTILDFVTRGFRVKCTMQDGSVKTYLFALLSDAYANVPSSLRQFVDIQPAEYTLDTQIGSNGIEIYYYDGKTAVFHDYFGLFVYDVTQQKIIHSVDVEPLGCNFTQGDQTCSIGVAPGGNTIYLNAMGADINYVYMVSENEMYTEPAETRKVWELNTNLDSMENVFGMGMAWPASSRVSYGCARTETEVAYLHRNSDTENTIRQLNLNVYNLETNRTIRYPLFREEKHVVWEDGAIFENAFFPTLALSVGTEEHWNPFFLVKKIVWDGAPDSDDNTRQENFLQLLGNEPAENVHYTPLPTQAEFSFPSIVYDAPVSVEILDSILDEQGKILGTFPTNALTEHDGIFTGFCMRSAADVGIDTYLPDSSVLHGVTIRATWANGNIGEYRFIARTDYK